MFIPDQGSKRFPDPGSASKNWSISTQKLFLSSRKYDPKCSILDSDLDFSPIPDPGVKKAPDPGSGSATLQQRVKTSGQSHKKTLKERKIRFRQKTLNTGYRLWYPDSCIRIEAFYFYQDRIAKPDLKPRSKNVLHFVLFQNTKFYAWDGIFKLLRNRFAILCILAGRYDNPMPTRFLAPIDCSKSWTRIYILYKSNAK